MLCVCHLMYFSLSLPAALDRRWCSLCLRLAPFGPQHRIQFRLSAPFRPRPEQGVTVLLLRRRRLRLRLRLRLGLSLSLRLRKIFASSFTFLAYSMLNSAIALRSLRSAVFLVSLASTHLNSHSV